jgi:hypothetical protein
MPLVERPPAASKTENALRMPIARTLRASRAYSR